jgi:DNA-binding MarR family transcriptional regulator
MASAVRSRAAAFNAVEEAFAGFAGRASLPRMRERLTATVDAGVDLSALRVLAWAERSGPARASDLAEATALDLSTVSRRVAELEGASLVTRTRDPDDRRASLLEVTPAGRAAIERLRAARRSLIEEALADWPTDDVRRLGELLGRFTGALADAV